MVSADRESHVIGAGLSGSGCGSTVGSSAGSSATRGGLAGVVEGGDSAQPATSTPTIEASTKSAGRLVLTYLIVVPPRSST